MEFSTFLANFFKITSILTFLPDFWTCGIPTGSRGGRWDVPHPLPRSPCLPLCPIYYHEPKLIFTEKQPPGIYPTQERMNSPTIMPDWFGLSENKTLRKIEESKSIDKFRIDKTRLFDHWMNLSITRNEVNEEFKSIVRNGGHYWVVLSECRI